jgi:4a-hydroxytetrahydrobiopterin dehydratase
LNLPKKDWAKAPRSALSSTQIGEALLGLPQWQLKDGAVEKTFHFANYFETMAFVNALALVAHTQDHHPDLSVHYNRCVVRWNTHDVQGISATDIDCARRADALLNT